MGYRSLLTVFTEAADTDPTLDAAIDMARRYDAHLDVLCVGLGLTGLPIGIAEVDHTVMIEAMKEAAARSAAMAAKARKRLEREDIGWAVEDAGAQAVGVGERVAPHARYADLVVLPWPTGRDRDIESEQVMEAALFRGHVPVLLVPRAGLPADPPQSIVVAWDGGDEAMAAARAALPMLAAAKTVSVALVDPGSRHGDGDDPAGAVARFLVRHHVNAEVFALPRAGATVAEVLNRHVRDRDAGLLVMGAYGHTRLRELILGGTTRDMLRDAAVPVLLAH